MSLFIRPFSKLTKSIPLRLILIVPFILQISIAVGLVGWLSIQNGNQAVNDVASQLRNETTARIEQYLKTYITTPQVINQLNANAVQLDQLNFQDLQSIEYYLWRQIQVFDLANEIKFGTPQGAFVAVERLENGSFSGKMSSAATGFTSSIYDLDRAGQPANLKLQIKNYNPRTRVWYKSAIQAGKATWGEIYKRPATPRPMVPFSLPVYDAEHNLICVASVDFSLYGISQYLNSLKIGRSGETFIIEHDGLLVGSSTTQPIFKVQGQQVQRFKATESQDVLTRSAAQALLNRFGDFARVTMTQQLDFKIDGQRQFLQVAPLQDQGLDWLIVVAIPEADFMDRINANTHSTILLCLAAFGVATGLGVLTARWITQPIFQLSRASRAIAQGELDQTVRVRGAIEITVLAQSFNQMAHQLQESFTQLERTNEDLELRVAQRTAALQASEAKFAAAFRSSPIQIAILTLSEGRYIDVNDAFSQAGGFRSEQIIGRTDAELGLEQASEKRLKLVRMLQKTGSIRNLEQDIHFPSGNIITTRVSAELIDLNGETCFLLVSEDITERKRSEEALRNSEAKFAAAFRSSPNPLAISTLNEGRFIEINESFCQIFGYVPGEVIGHTSLELNLLQSQIQREKFTESLQAKKAISNQEMEFVGRSGEVRTLLMSAELITIDSTCCILWVGYDITERKQIEAALQRSEAKYRGIFENSQVGILRSRAVDGLFLDANQHLSTMLGYESPIDLIGIKRTTDFYVDPNARAEILDAYRDTHQFDNVEIQLRKRDGSTFWALISSRLTEADHEEAVISDISDRKRAEAASILEERNRMAQEIHDTLAQAFTSIIIHLEAATLKLTSDLEAAQMLLNTGRDLARSGLAEARRSVEALRPLVLEEYDLYHALERLAEQMFAHTGVQVICDRIGSTYALDPVVENNLLRIGQEALNNALKYAKATEIRVGLRYERSHLILKIADDGQGFIVKNQVSAGFGLLGMTERSERIGATLSIQSELGCGTMITVAVDRRRVS